MTLYEDLLQQKQNGKVISIKDLSKEDLYQLYCVEHKGDAEIAEICNSQKKNIRAKRHRLGVLIYDRAILDTIEKIKTYPKEEQDRLLKELYSCL